MLEGRQPRSLRACSRDDPECGARRGVLRRRLVTVCPGRPGTPPARHYDLAARSSLHGSGRQMPAVAWRRAPKETEARPRGPKPPRWSAERRASRVMGRKAPRKRLACRVMARPTGASHAPERLSALRPPLFAGERSNDANPGRKKRAAGTRRCDMSAAKKRTRAEEALAAAEQRRLAPVLREAHARLGLWRTCDDKTCRRGGSCGGEVDQCGARVGPQGWAWLHQVIKAMREGKSQSAAVEAANFAALGYRERVTISWPNCPFWEPLEFFMRNDGTMIRTVIAPAQPDIDPQFIALA